MSRMSRGGHHGWSYSSRLNLKWAYFFGQSGKMLGGGRRFDIAKIKSNGLSSIAATINIPGAQHNIRGAGKNGISFGVMEEPKPLPHVNAQVNNKQITQLSRDADNTSQYRR